MTDKELREHRRLSKKWMLGKATKSEISRCWALDRQESFEAKKAKAAARKKER